LKVVSTRSRVSSSTRPWSRASLLPSSSPCLGQSTFPAPASAFNYNP